MSHANAHRGILVGITRAMKKKEDIKRRRRSVGGTHRELEGHVKNEYNQNVLRTCMEFPKIIKLSFKNVQLCACQTSLSPAVRIKGFSHPYQNPYYQSFSAILFLVFFIVLATFV